MNSRSSTALIISGLMLVLSGCGGGGCTSDVRPGLVLTFQDYETGMPLCGVHYKISSESFAEENTAPLEGYNCNQLSLLDEKSGSYTLEITREGYRPVDFDVEIYFDGCHVVTERQNIDLIAL